MGGSLLTRRQGCEDYPLAPVRPSQSCARSMARDLLEDATAHPPSSGETALAAFAYIFLDDCARRWKPSTLRSHRHAMSRYTLPGLGHMQIGEVERSDVTVWFNKMEMSKGGRNRALSLLSSLLIHAEIRGLRLPGSNPCAGMRRHDMRFQASYLHADGYAALGRAFAKASATSPMAVRALRLCALTGCRKLRPFSSVISMRASGGS